MCTRLGVLEGTGPHGSRHTSVVGKHVLDLRGYSKLPGNKTVGLGKTGREMIIGGVVLDKGELLEREVTPVLIDVYEIVFKT